MPWSPYGDGGRRPAVAGGPVGWLKITGGTGPPSPPRPRAPGPRTEEPVEEDCHASGNGGEVRGRAGPGLRALARGWVAGGRQGEVSRPSPPRRRDGQLH